MPDLGIMLLVEHHSTASSIKFCKDHELTQAKNDVILQTEEEIRDIVSRLVLVWHLVHRRVHFRCVVGLWSM